MPERVAGGIEEIARPNRDDQPAEWKIVDFDWDNPSSGSQPAIPRCITPRPWLPYLAAKEQDDDQDG
jgi:hypothetical protein